MIEKSAKPDAVNHPAHYTYGSIEVIDAIESWQMGFHAGNVIKYVARHKHKNGLQDLLKARWYLNRLIDNESSNLPKREKRKRMVKKIHASASRLQFASTVSCRKPKAKPWLAR